MIVNAAFRATAFSFPCSTGIFTPIQRYVKTPTNEQRYNVCRRFKISCPIPILTLVLTSTPTPTSAPTVSLLVLLFSPVAHPPRFMCNRIVVAGHRWDGRPCPQHGSPFIRRVSAASSTSIGAGVFWRRSRVVVPVMSSIVVQKVARLSLFNSVHCRTSTRTLTNILVGGYVHQLRQRYIRWRPHWAGAAQARQRPISASRSNMSCSRKSPLARVCTIPPRLQENTALLAAVWRWRCEAAGHRRKAPLFDVCFYKDKSTLPKVDVYRTRPVSADRWEEILGLKAMRHIIQFLAVAREEYCSCARPITDANNVTLYILGSVWGWGERLVIPSVTAGCVCD